MAKTIHKERDALSGGRAGCEKWRGLSCKVLDIGLESFVVCLEKHPHTCAFSLSFGSKYFCKNRLYVDGAKHRSP